jgi:dTDP-4-dehydrorhamnose 3,5-epimerase-like enzyme
MPLPEITRLTMLVEKTDLPGLLLIKPRYFRDERGFFIETFSRGRYREAGMADDFAVEQRDSARSAFPGPLSASTDRDRHARKSF